MLLTPVRMFSDGVGSAYVLRYHRIAAQAFRGRCTSAPHTCSLHCSFLDTVACTPHLWKECMTRFLEPTIIATPPCPHCWCQTTTTHRSHSGRRLLHAATIAHV